MEIWVKVVSGIIVKRKLVKIPPKDVAIGPDGFPIWRQFLASVAPAYNPATHLAPLPLQTSDIGDPVYVPGVTVLGSWNAPVAKTQQEIDDEAEALANSQVTRVDAKSLERAFANAMFDIAKAARTNDWTSFKLADGTPVTTRLQWRQYLLEQVNAA